MHWTELHCTSKQVQNGAKKEWQDLHLSTPGLTPSWTGLTEGELLVKLVETPIPQ